MASSLSITYLHHSGFAVRTRNTLLVFDDARPAARDEDTPEKGYITRTLLEGDGIERTIFFVSHAHADHFSEGIYALSDAGVVHYVLGYDLPSHHSGYHMRPGETLQLAGAEITAFDSTDEGVSFLVEIDGWSLFHAGDLNLWHWRDESTLKEIEQAERAFLAAVSPLLSRPIDIAFFPLDPRMGQQYDAGALHFLMHIKPRVMIPMHWWDRSDAAVGFARRNRSRHVEIVALTEPGEHIQAEKNEAGDVAVTAP